MSKRYKIKRTSGRIYNPIRGKLIKGGLALLAAAVLFLLGWLVYEPVYSALTANSSGPEAENPASSGISVPDTDLAAESEPEPAMFDGSVRAAFAPAEVFADDALWEKFLRDAGRAGLNAVVFDIKDADGNVTYSSEQASVAAVESRTEKPADLAARVEQAESAGMTAIARIYAFEDKLASAGCAEMAIRYMDEDGVVWLDDAPEHGGRSWLNPYSDMAQKYILDIVYDAIFSGCGCVLMDGVRFPQKYGMQFAYFGNIPEDAGRREVLQEFTRKVRSACEKRGVEMLLGFSGASMFSGDTDIYGGSPMVMPADGYSPSFMPSELTGMENLPKSLSYASLPEDLGAVIRSMVKELSLATDAELMPGVQAYEVSASDILAMTGALRGAGIDDYILYGGGDTGYLEDMGGAVAGEPRPEDGGDTESSEDSESYGDSESQEDPESSEESSESSDVPEITLPSGPESVKQAETFGG